VRAVRAAGARYILATAPVGSVEAEARLDREVDKVLLLRVPASFHAVGQWYQQFEQLEDADVTALLSRSQADLEQLNPPAG
jgi:putative phosphoribosyl transferase